MAQTLANKIALVTGGAQGLGAALCQRLAQEGCDVVVADLNLDRRRADSRRHRRRHRATPDRGQGRRHR